jgi:hypothetical protein
MEEQKAAAFTEKLVKCSGMLLPHATNCSLGEGNMIPSLDTDSTRHYSNIRMSGKVLNKNGL